MTEKSPINVGLLGLGVVGSGVADILINQREILAQKSGIDINLSGVAVRDKTKSRTVKINPDLITENPSKLINNPEIDIIVELIGGEEPALNYILESISNNKHVVSANKEVIAKHGSKIFQLANKKHVDISYEASVAGGTPIIGPLSNELVSNKILSIRGIINGTTNYILTKMDQEGADLETTLSQAQKLGYAEADPTNDIEGFDARYKIAILSSLSFRKKIPLDSIFCEGITKLHPLDFIYAKELGYSIKLLAIANNGENGIQIRVHPTMLPTNHPLANISGVLNAVEVETDLIGKVMFHGAGAGAKPTSSAVIADIIKTSHAIQSTSYTSSPLFDATANSTITSIDDLITNYYLRVNVIEKPGVFAQIAKLIGDLDISISSAIQKQTDEADMTAEIVFMTHKAKESSMIKAIKNMKNLNVVNYVGSLIRVEE